MREILNTFLNGSEWISILGDKKEQKKPMQQTLIPWTQNPVLEVSPCSCMQGKFLVEEDAYIHSYVAMMQKKA